MENQEKIEQKREIIRDSFEKSLQDLDWSVKLDSVKYENAESIFSLSFKMYDVIGEGDKKWGHLKIAISDDGGYYWRGHRYESPDYILIDFSKSKSYKWVGDNNMSQRYEDKNIVELKPVVLEYHLSKYTDINWGLTKCEKNHRTTREWSIYNNGKGQDIINFEELNDGRFAFDSKIYSNVINLVVSIENSLD